jgi:predicted dehydrogenase
MAETNPRLGVGFIGSGSVTSFHLKSWVAVRHADVRGIWSTNLGHAEGAAALARTLRVGDAKAFRSIEEMVAAPEIDAIWICGPNHHRIENLEAIVAAREKGAELVGIACEKPLARNVSEGKRMVELVKKAGILHGYLEGQLFAPSLERGRELAWARGAALSGRPYLARATEEHSGPDRPWLWQGELQGGGALNEMMCHGLEVGRFLLTRPGAPRASLTPRKLSAQIASLKWSRPEYAKALRESMGPEVDYAKNPAEDFARAAVTYQDESGQAVIAESTTSWSFVGPGLRLSIELLGPEYSLAMNSLDSGARLFLSRRVNGAAGAELIEKQNAEQGLMPVIGAEAAEYGYEGENRHFTRAFLEGRQPELSFEAGLEVTELLMACYLSAEQERVVNWKPPELDSFVPAVARRAWKPWEAME